MPDTDFADFRLYHSNALDVLASLLARELQQPLAGQSPLLPDTIIIPQAAMRRWLQATLAAEYGVAANLEFLTPGELVARALNANIPGEAEDIHTAALQWRLYAALTDNVLMQQPALRRFRHYLHHDDPLRPWALAGELADVFEKYQAWRRDWLLAWEAGAEADDPQAILWRQVAGAQRRHRARRIDMYLKQFAQPGSALPHGLPARLFVFATLNISPDVLQVMATQARVGTLHFYLPTPTRSYWGDMQTLAERLRRGVTDPFYANADENPLLQAWGAAGRDFMEVLGSYEVVHPRGEIDAYVEPEAQPQSLLHQLQADLFHRRAATTPLRPQFDVDDPSLQIHACHTPLREVQVLHDQLRALLEDTRFDPPLEPRQIAVLAPDIAPYVPWLEAVFGSRSGDSSAIAWTLADTSPLQDEPLAELFLQLLNLPLSRFGLNELLDMLSSQALSHLSGLDQMALEHLHHWLHEAGARWGIHARHRQQHHAPLDNAYTWEFALDRLLLGYASGCDEDDDIAGVAPWPYLEGSALQALDTLIGIMRVLSRQQRELAGSYSPAQWQQRLLNLLRSLLPETPADPATARALERLRRLIHEFADQAARADFSGNVPAEIVRAHFAQVLAQADTRAPLLTGGVSFGRMVPLRLLPFRVICVLGMNDGDYPRRDPVAGLSRLTIDLHSARRRRGDRSLREDDRFLFLQLFSAAQEVFYISYQGHHPRDGSVREPSVLVSDLIEAAAQRHEDAESVRQSLVVHHALHPFSASAFGGPDEPRQFSYQQQWHQAVNRIHRQRQSLTWWCNLDVDEVNNTASHLSITRLPLQRLRAFLINPARTFLKHRLGIYLPKDNDTDIEADIEPLTIPERGWKRTQLQQYVLHQCLQGNTQHLYECARARALLPSGAMGQRQFQLLLEEIQPCISCFNTWYDGRPLQTRRVAIELGALTIYGQISAIHPQALVRLYAGKPDANWMIETGLDWLLINAAGAALPLLQFYEADSGSFGPHSLPALSTESARAALELLHNYYQRGLHFPLLYSAYTAWNIYQASPEKKEETALKHWQGSDTSWGDIKKPELQLSFRGKTKLTHPQDIEQLIHISHDIFTALREGRIL